MGEARNDSGAALLSDAASPSQLRIDLWNHLRDGVEELASGRGEAHREELESLFRRMEELERLWAYPGPERLEQVRRTYRAGDLGRLRALANELVDGISTVGDRAALADVTPAAAHYFTLLWVDPVDPAQLRSVRARLPALRAEGRGDLGLRDRAGRLVRGGLAGGDVQQRHPGGGDGAEHPRARRAADHRAGLRAELDKVVAPLADGIGAGLRGAGGGAAPAAARAGSLPAPNESLTDSPRSAQLFSRVFYRFEPAHELHVDPARRGARPDEGSVLRALRAYADQPIGNFHALPIARGHSVFHSAWIQDFGHFYGVNLFMAESSSTAGGLDSLLEPTGTIKEAQALAARASARRTTSSSPTGPRPPTRSSTWRCCGRATLSSSTATATSRTTMAWRWRGRGRST